MPKLIIFDCDGVLVDSEPLSNRVIAEIMCEIGIPMTTEEAIQLFAGGSLKRVKDFIFSKTGHAPPPGIEDLYRERSYALFKKELQPIAGIQQALETISFKKCVASNGPLHKMKLNLELTGLSAFFEQNLFSANEVGYWKPDPRLFLHAAEKMGYAPDKCIVIEDSIHGIHAAKAAGMKVLGFSNSDYGEKLKSERIQTFHLMAELAEILNDF
jgi:HAD superfamily hydrolase (TIGR01509 family)